MSCLHWLAYRNDLKCIQYLLDQDVAIQKDLAGRTALDIAAKCQMYDALEIFFKYFIDELREFTMLNGTQD